MSEPASPPSSAAFYPSVLVFTDEQGDVTQLQCDNGDLIATAITGPNAGKSVNLTYGKWA